MMRPRTLGIFTLLVLALSSCLPPVGSPPPTTPTAIPLELIYSTESDGYFEVFVGESYTPNVSFVPADASNKNLIYTMENPLIAQVDATGTVTGVSDGTTDLTIESEDGGFQVTLGVSVQTFVQITGINALSFFDDPIQVGQETLFWVDAEPWDSSTDYTLTSSNENVAVIEQNYWIQGRSAGTTTITVVANDDPSLSASAVLTVTDDTTEPSLELVTMSDAQTLVVMFSEAMDAATISNPTSYTFSSGPAGLLVNPTAVQVVDEGTAILALNQPLTYGEGFTLDMAVSDAAGNSANLQTVFVYQSKPSTPDADHIVITGGFMYGNAGSALPGPSGAEIFAVFLLPAGEPFGTDSIVAIQIVETDGSFEPLLDPLGYTPMMIPSGEYDLYSSDENDVFSLPLRISVP